MQRKGHSVCDGVFFIYLNTYNIKGQNTELYSKCRVHLIRRKRTKTLCKLIIYSWNKWNADGRLWESLRRRLHGFTPWTSTPVGTWGTAAGPAASSATSGCSACGNSGSTDPRPAGSRLLALCLQNIAQHYNSHWRVRKEFHPHEILDLKCCIINITVPCINGMKIFYLYWMNCLLTMFRWTYWNQHYLLLLDHLHVLSCICWVSFKTTITILRWFILFGGGMPQTMHL